MSAGQSESRFLLKYPDIGHFEVERSDLASVTKLRIKSISLE